MRLRASQRESCASSQTFAIVISSLAPGAAVTCECSYDAVRVLTRSPAAVVTDPVAELTLS